MIHCGNMFKKISFYICSFFILIAFISNVYGQDKKYRVGVIGDSISEGFLTWSNKKSFPNVLDTFAEQIRKDFEVVSIDALAGRTTERAFVLTQNIIQESDINVLILELGGNDLIQDSDFNSEKFKNNLTASIEYALDQNIKVIFTPVSVPDHLIESQSWFGTDKTFNLGEIQLYERINQEICFDFEDNSNFHCYPNLLYSLERSHFFDAVHPTALGHRMIAYELLKCINGFIPPSKEDFIKELDISMVDAENTAVISLGDLTNYFITKNKIDLSSDLESYHFKILGNQAPCTIGEDGFVFEIDSEWDNLFRFAARDGEDKSGFEYIKRKGKVRQGLRNAVFMNEFLDTEYYYKGNIKLKAEKFFVLAPQILNVVCNRFELINKQKKIDLFEIFWTMYQIDNVATYLLTKLSNTKYENELNKIKQAALVIKKRLVNRINIRFKALKLLPELSKKLYESLNPEVLLFLDEHGFIVPEEYK